MEQYWGPCRGKEHFALSPINIPGLEEYYANLPRLSSVSAAKQEADRSAASSTAVAARGSTDAQDLFFACPAETLSLIMLHLRPKSLGKFVMASRAAYQILPYLGNRFWKMKILRDMRWLYDLPVASTGRDGVPDWKRVYRELWRASRVGSGAIPGLVNRRRIWVQPLPQIIDKYQAVIDEKNAREMESWPNSLVGAHVTESIALAPPVKNTLVALVDDLKQVPTATVNMLVYFDEREEICGLAVDSHDSPSREPIDPLPVSVARADRVPIGDWVTGFIVFTTAGWRDAADSSHQDQDQDADGSAHVRRVVGINVLMTQGKSVLAGRSEGCAQLPIYVDPGRFIAGLRVHTSARGVLCKIDLLHQEPWRTGPDVSRINDHPHRFINLNTMKHIWHGTLPSSEPQLSEVQTYRSCNSSPDTDEEIPVTAMLAIGMQDDDRAQVTELLIDVHLGGFEVRYVHGRRPQMIGPRRSAMKSLKIDGRGGERILMIHSPNGDTLNGLRFVTNRNRQLIVGEPGPKGTEKRSGPWGWPVGAYPPPAGLVCSWTDDGTRMNAFGHVNRAALRGETFERFPSLSMRDHDVCWEPTAPPLSWKGYGPVYGARILHQDEGQEAGFRVPDDCQLVSWMDCVQPLSEIRITMRRGLATGEMPLVGLVFQCSDEHQDGMVTGPTVFSPPAAQLGSEDDKSHSLNPMGYVQDSWKLGGQRLRALRVWSQDRGALQALQFVAEDGSMSPRWCLRDIDDDKMEEIKFEAGGGEALGLKLFFSYEGSGKAGYHEREILIQALQAMRCDDLLQASASL